MLHKGNNHSDVFMAQSLDDTLLWETAQWEANKLLQRDEPEYVGKGFIDTLWCGAEEKYIYIKKKIPSCQDVSSCDSRRGCWVGKKRTHSKSASPCTNSTGAQRRLTIRWSQAPSGMFGTSWIPLWPRQPGLKQGQSHSASLHRTDSQVQPGAARCSPTQTLAQLQVEEGKNPGDTTASPGSRCV